MKRALSLLLTLLLLFLFLTGCGKQAGSNDDRTYRLAPLGGMPHELQQARARARQAYQFAAYNQEVLARLPCYCGCSAMGHISNYSCYVAGTDEDGYLVYDNHALGCAICVDITQDAMRLLDAGKSVDEIYEHVVATYSRFGPSTSRQGKSNFVPAHFSQ